jgi:tight adherence protein C
VTLLLLTGLALTGITAILVLRSVAMGRARQRATLAQIGAYGFHSPVPAAATSRDLRGIVHAAASAAGNTIVKRVSTDRERRMRRDLDAAGLYRTSVATYLGYRVLGVAVPLGLAFLASASGSLTWRTLLVFGSFTAMSALFPAYIVKRRARLRREQVDREVPELVDLLVTTVEAGVGFGGGLQLAARSIRGPLGDELRLALQEQSLGLSGDQALRNLTGRVDSPALRAFSQALIQGESLGVSIGKVLRDLAVDMRKRRRQSAEERAQKTPTLILFPLIALILPATFILTVGPAVVRVLKFLGEGP